MTKSAKPVAEWSDEKLLAHAQMLRDSIRQREERLDTILDILAERKGGSE